MIEQYRKANQNDLDEIMELIASAITAMCKNGIMQWDDMYPTRDDFQQDILQGTLEVGVVQGKIAVIFALNQACDEQYQNGDWADKNASYTVIHRLCVHPQFQKKGIARETLGRIEDMVVAQRIDYIRLDVFSQNPGAVKLYEHNGYKRVGETNWRKGMFYLMEKQLNQAKSY